MPLKIFTSITGLFILASILGVLLASGQIAKETTTAINNVATELKTANELNLKTIELIETK